MVGGKSQSIEGKPSSNISNAEDEDPTFSGELYGKFTAGNGQGIIIGKLNEILYGEIAGFLKRNPGEISMKQNDMIGN